MKLIKILILASAMFATMTGAFSAQAGSVVNRTARIVSVFSDTHSTLSIRFYFEGIEKDLCGPGTREWAYVNEDDGKWGVIYPTLLSAFIAKKPVQVYVIPRSVNGSPTEEFCQAIVVKVKNSL